MQLEQDDELSAVLTMTQAAELVDRAPATIRDWIRRGKLEPIRIGRRVFVTARSVLEVERDIREGGT